MFRVSNATVSKSDPLKARMRRKKKNKEGEREEGDRRGKRFVGWRGTLLTMASTDWMVFGLMVWSYVSFRCLPPDSIYRCHLFVIIT